MFDNDRSAPGGTSIDGAPIRDVGVGSMSRGTGGSLRVGCSGWSYRDWSGPVYPLELPQRLWFDHYQNVFDTVELNSTFYRLPSASTAARWASTAREGFIFAVKMGAYGSHRKKLLDAPTWLPNHVDRVERLGDHAGPNLVQLPPGWKRNVARLDEFLHAAPRSIRWAVELREPSWLHDDVFEVLSQHSAALCLHDLLIDHPVQLTTDWTYVRFHGPDAPRRPYQGAYGADGLGPRVEQLGAVLDACHDVYAYFNNDRHGHAVSDAAVLRRALTGRGPSTAVPAESTTLP